MQDTSAHHGTEDSGSQGWQVCLQRHDQQHIRVGCSPMCQALISALGSDSEPLGWSWPKGLRHPGFPVLTPWHLCF